MLYHETLDPAILAALPVGSKVVSVVPHGKTRWSTGLKVDIEADGQEQSYFLKGSAQMRGTACGIVLILGDTGHRSS